MKEAKEIKLTAHFNPHEKCVFVDGQGQAVFKLTTDATQLAKVLSSFAKFKDKPIEVILRECKNGNKTLENRQPKKVYR